MSLRVSVLACVAATLPLFATQANARQEPTAIRAAVERFLSIQIKGLPGEASYTVGRIDPNNQLAACGSFDVSMAAGARSWGRTTVLVRCLQPTSWSMFVPVHIRVVTEYLVSARALAQGRSISPGDLVRRRGDLSDLPTGVLTDEREAIGRTAGLSIAAGRPIRSDMLRQPLVIKQNQTVTVVSRGSGFQVTNEGRALTNGLDGQIIQVRLANGQVVSGTARAGGVVEIGF